MNLPARRPAGKSFTLANCYGCAGGGEFDSELSAKNGGSRKGLGQPVTPANSSLVISV
jgi:hypothetical protein